MFDLNLAHIHRAEQERELAADLRAREILKAADGPIATDTAATTDTAADRRVAAARTTTRVRAVGR